MDPILPLLISFIPLSLRQLSKMVFSFLSCVLFNVINNLESSHWPYDFQKINYFKLELLEAK
jgi:hypothetical protein